MKRRTLLRLFGSHRATPAQSGVGRALREDVRANLLGSDLLSAAGIAKILTLRTACVVLFRVAQGLGRHSGFVAGVIKQFNQLISGADLAWQAEVGPGLVLFHPVGVVIGPDVVIGKNAIVQQGVTVGGRGGLVSKDESPVIGDHVLFGAGAKVVGSVKIGHRVRIGANAVVTKDVPDDCDAIGVPAKWRTR